MITGYDSSSNLNRSKPQLNIHNLFIFNLSGICLYSQNFTNSYTMDSNLITSFFAALMSFTKEVIGNKFHTIEMGKTKFVIFYKNTFFYSILSNSDENLVFLETLITQINTQFVKYIAENKINIEIQYVQDKRLDIIIEKIVNDEFSIEYNQYKEARIKDFLKKMALDDEIKGLLLLTDKGKLVYSSLNRSLSNSFLKEVDFRVKICNNSILKLFYTSKNEELILSEYVADLYFIILIFDINTKFGIADYYLHKAVKKIETILKE
ncbi:MAG: hypothetical protein ACFFAO_04740 [Candidatus Hermodarchaeota archaeon]